jgi:hypothetical protein
MKKSLHSEWSLKKPLYVEKKDKRYAKHLKQLKENGFSDSETWSLDSVICQFILPRLIRFKEVNNGFPIGLTEQEWNDILDKMIFSLDWSLNWEEDKYDALSKEEQAVMWKRYDEGIALFSKHFRDLWW